MITAGFGFRHGATLDSLLDAYAQTGQAADQLATAETKAQSATIQSLSRHLDLPVVAICPDELTAQTTQTQSAPSRAAHGTGSVAEAAALAAAGPGARLLAPRVISSDKLATCALAEGAPT